MISPVDTKIKACAIHRVGNKLRDESCILSENIYNGCDNVYNFLIEYFFTPFKSEEYFSFYHNINITMNEVYMCVRNIFSNPNTILNHSIDLAKHLYEKSIHPKVKGGEFYVVYFEDCIIDGKNTNAIGLFKSENKDTFLKIHHKNQEFIIESEKGINLNKLDKGCLVFNIEEENGYLVAVVDNTNKGSEAKYWTDDFLHVHPRKDSFNQTQNLLSLCKSFVSHLPCNNGKIEKATYMNRSVEALKEESVNINTFAEQVFENPKLVSEFKQYKETYQKERDIEIDDSFSTASNAIKRRATGTMTTIKLDKNFDINIHGGEQYIIRGYDEERKMYYYQLFFNEEK